MAEETPLDAAYRAMEAAPGDETARLGFYGQLVAGEMFLMLEKDATDGEVTPRVFPLDDGPYVLAYDREERLARFAGGPTPYAALPGREIARLVAGAGLGLGVNLGEAPSEILLPADAVAWLAETLAAQPAELRALPRDLSPPSGLPEQLLTALDRRLAAAGGLASSAYLAAVTYHDGGRGHLLAFIDAADGAEAALARAVGEALTFSGLEAGTIDVAFFPAAHVIAARLSRVALKFDLPQIAAPETPTAPGSDPERPPKLR